MKIRQIAILLLIQLVCCCGKTENNSPLVPPPSPGSEEEQGSEEGGSTDPNPPAPTPQDGYIVVGYAYADSGQLPDPTLPRFSYKKYAVTSSFTM